MNPVRSVNVCVSYLCTQGEGIFTYYRRPQHIQPTCIVFQYKGKSSPLSAELVLVTAANLFHWKQHQKVSIAVNNSVSVWKKVFVIRSFTNFPPARTSSKYVAVKLICNEQRCGPIPLWSFLLPYIICKVGIKGFSFFCPSVNARCTKHMLVIWNPCPHTPLYHQRGAPTPISNPRPRVHLDEWRGRLIQSSGLINPMSYLMNDS